MRLFENDQLKQPMHFADASLLLWVEWLCSATLLLKMRAGDSLFLVEVSVREDWNEVGTWANNTIPPGGLGKCDMILALHRPQGA